ncbi:MAG TPA: Gfo/Idh/MocA family oxidoreductase [Clostridiales bacterium]|jgi:dihydrodiol dehydrogenase / D-xylose 1-dehydrogenase (NADP)|nr:Gfo/Idh/MocA family oxidoreductase [Clostridiales bacterium]
MKTIRWGIIGTGNISSTFAKAVTSLEGAKLVAVASRSQERANEFAEKFHIEKAYGSYQELALDPELDVVYIGTPHTEHFSNARECIINKKAVLCEKPITLNQSETMHLIELAKEHKVFLMEAMWTKFLPVTQQVKQWVKEKRIGTVKHLKISFGFYKDFDPEHRLFNPNLAGGALLDVGIYPITYTIHMLDKLPDQILSFSEIGKSGVDEQNVIIFKYNEGMLAQLSSSVLLDTGDDAEIIGENGRIVVPKFWMAESALLYDKEGKLLESCSIPHKVNGYEYEAMEVNRCLRDGKLESDLVPLKDTLNIMKLMDQMRNEWGLKYPQEEE